MKLTVVSGEPPWELGAEFDATFPVQLVVIWAEPPWIPGRILTASMDQPETINPYDDKGICR